MQELASQLGLRARTTEALLGPRPSFRKQGCNVTSTLGQVHAKQVALSNTPLGTSPAQACVSQPTCPYSLRWERNHHLTLKLAERGHTEGSWWVCGCPAQAREGIPGRLENRHQRPRPATDESWLK